MDGTHTAQGSGKAERSERRTARPRTTVKAASAWVLRTLALTAAIVTLGAGPSLLAGAPSRSFAATTVTVAASDTLWSIAASHRLPGRSVAATVDAIREANGMDGSSLAAGSTLRVPTTESMDAAFADAGGAAQPR